jgi:hypothetical protein
VKNKKRVMASCAPCVSDGRSPFFAVLSECE